MEQPQLNWIANFIWGIADDVLRDLYVRGKYRDVILPMTVLRRIDSLLESTKQAVLDMKASLDKAGIVHQDQALRQEADMDSYRVEKQAAVKIQLTDADAEIEPVPTAGGGRKPEPELDRLSNILKTFNDQFGNIPWTDADRVHKLITEDIPARVAADTAYQNAKKNSDKQNARIEHDKALARVMTAVLKDDTELFKQFMDNESFRRWLTDTVFGLTYEPSVGREA